MRNKRLITGVLIIMMLTLTACGGNKKTEEDEKSAEKATSKETIKIATKPMVEQYILGEMLGELIEKNTDYKVEITKGIQGGTNNIQPAMEKGEFDLYPEYTSSGYTMVLKHDPAGVDDKEMFEQLQKEYSDQFEMTWKGQYGFNNTFAIAVRKEVAKQYDLKTCSDLSKVSDKLVFGGNPDYIEREDGFKVLCDEYGYHFKKVTDIDIALKYQAMQNGEIDVTNGFTTDAQLSLDDYVVLEDDKNLQVNYFCATVVREDALEKYKGLEDALMLMEGLLTDKEMATLNYAVEVDGQDEADVAHKFLVKKGLAEE
ncbi:MAG: glycine/betaine ABC transporter substrate-binding protein [Lachnospiraceae bacterium]|nr:glycine/betaine ABC transporter substrate-binding protein [Lachnospiraceae bacterium]